MDQRVSLVTLAVADVKRSRTFYEQGLGWKPGFTGDDIVFYQLRGSILGLWDKKAMAKDLGVPPTQLATGAVQVAHNVADRSTVDRILAQAATAGARIVKPAHDAVWGGYTGLFADPDGHVWEVAWNPAWKLSADGAVALI